MEGNEIKLNIATPNAAIFRIQRQEITIIVSLSQYRWRTECASVTTLSKSRK